MPVNAKEIESRFLFRTCRRRWIGLFAPDNGVINVPLLLRTLLSLAKAYGAEAKQHTHVESIRPPKTPNDSYSWEVHTNRHGKDHVVYKAKKIVIASGAYVNHVLKTELWYLS